MDIVLQTPQDKAVSLKNHVQIPRSTVSRLVPCTFIFPRKRRRRWSANTSDSIQDESHVSRAQEPHITRNIVLGSPFIESLSPTWMARDSISTPMTRTSPSMSGRSSYIKESSSTGTFGWRQSSFPDSILTGPARPPYTTKEGVYHQGPLTAGCISDCSTEPTGIFTPADPLFLREPPSPDKLFDDKMADHLGEPKSPFFSIASYRGDDSAVMPFREPELASNDPNVNSQHPFKTQPSQGPSITHSVSSPSLHRARRPPPLVIPPLQYQALPAGHAGVCETPIQSAVSSQFSLPRVNTPRKDKSPVSDYIKNLRLELWIDQEEHRTIRAKFAYKRHIPPPTASAVGQRQTDEFWKNITSSGLVDMRMTEKKTGIFYCGKFSRQAAIRRAIVDERDDKDYISRNIILPLKDNGVYTVHGLEDERKGKGSQRKLVWKFEYAIDDKSPIQTNGVVNKEKVLRPISFICSPEILLPSQGIQVTIVHLLSKNIHASLVAKRIPPPAMPAPTSAVPSELSLPPGSAFSSRERRQSLIGSVVKSLSRPTTPATDRRLRGEIGLRRPSNASGSLPITPRNSASKSEQPISSGPYLAPALRNSQGSSHRGSRSGSHSDMGVHSVSNSGGVSAGSKGLMIEWDAPETMKQLFITRNRGASESSSKRPRTVSSILGKSPKLNPVTLFTRPRSNSRPATIAAERSRSSIGHNFSQYTLGSTNSSVPITPAPPPPWFIPTEEEVLALLEQMTKVVNKEQERLEMLARIHESKDAPIERIDSSGDLHVDSSTSSSPRHPVNRKFALRPIASFSALDRKASDPSLSSKRRPATASEAHTRLPARPKSLANLKRPETTDGHHKKNMVTWAQSSRSQNTSRTSIGLPTPPRRSKYNIAFD